MENMHANIYARAIIKAQSIAVRWTSGPGVGMFFMLSQVRCMS
jgi:hypothetical protein